MRDDQWPRAWMMSDERMGEALWPALERLSPGDGIVLRHYHAPDRAALAERVASVAKARGLVLAVAGDLALAARVGAALVHNPDQPGSLPFSRSAHSRAEALGAERDGAALLFVSPVFPTPSHPGQPALGRHEAERIARAVKIRAIALGGMDQERFAALDGFHGWAGIDAWLSSKPSRE